MPVSLGSRESQISKTAKSSRFLSTLDAVEKTIWLNGNVVGGPSGWNGTSPGPLVTVTSGETVRLLLNGIDLLVHNWFIDVYNNSTDVAGEISSPVFSYHNSPLPFIFRPVIGQNIPAGGNWTYRCMYHQGIMYGTIRVLQPSTLAPADFSLSVQSQSLKIHSGGSNTTTLLVKSTNNFLGNVSLSSSPPAGPIIIFAPNPVPLSFGSTNTSTIQIVSPPQLPADSYSVTLTGTRGTLTHSVTLTIIVQDFRIALTPTTISENAGISRSFNVTVTSINNFVSSVDLTTSASPSAGLACRMNLASVALTSGGTATSTVTCSGSAGSYTVTVTGTSGSASHRANLSFRIIASTPSPIPASNPRSMESSFPILTLGVIAVIIAGISIAGLFAVRGTRYRLKADLIQFFAGWRFD